MHRLGPYLGAQNWACCAKTWHLMKPKGLYTQQVLINRVHSLNQRLTPICALMGQTHFDVYHRQCQGRPERYP